jgi:uncharacterized membrane protein YkvA (DUF1232 family)
VAAVAFYRDREVPAWSKLVGLAALLYDDSPMDLSPDVVPLLGWLDAAGVVAAVAAWYARRIGQYRERRALVPAPRP